MDYLVSYFKSLFSKHAENEFIYTYETPIGIHFEFYCIHLKCKVSFEYNKESEEFIFIHNNNKVIAKDIRNLYNSFLKIINN
jgi:hypothetical protein